MEITREFVSLLRVESFQISGNPIGLGWEQSGPQQNQGNVYFLNNQQATSDNGQWVDSQAMGELIEE